MDIYKEIKTHILIIFAILFFIYYNIFVNNDPKSIFFIFAILIVLYSLYSKKKEEEETKTANIVSYMDNIEKTLDHDYEVPENKIFAIHKTPRNIKYLKRTEDLRQIVYDIKFLEIYDEALYEKIISYIEYFLKIHYKVMLGKYEFELYFPVLKDTRNEILNSMKTIYFNIPNISTILYIKNMDVYVDERIIKMQSITYKYMKALYHKYNKSNTNRSSFSYQAPFENDMMKDKHYNIF